MLPLMFAKEGEVHTIKQIGGKPEVKKHLENLGFTVGGKVSVITSVNGNLVVSVKETRVAISSVLAQKIMI